MTIPVTILVLALIGNFISFYIFSKKRRNERVFCLIGSDCNGAIYSKYSKTFGIPNETLGILYYSSIILLFLIQVLSVFLLDQFFMTFLLVAMLLATIYSIYLTGIQLFALKKLCELCLVVNVCNIAIFTIAVIGIIL